MEPQRSYERLGADVPQSPIVLSVPHGGRDYPGVLAEQAAVPIDRLAAFEDRHVDTLARAAWRGEAMLVARRPRAWIDLNRSPRERDPRVEADMPATAVVRSDKVRAGLGIVPRRTGNIEMAWRRRLTGAEVAARIADDHEPYHDALSALLAAARRRFGIAVLLDIHSMPPLGGSAPPMIVLGDRFGRSAAPRLVARAEDAVRETRLRTATNTPYAGGYILERHGAPARGIHAIQIELDRRLYLDAELDRPGPGFDATARLLRAVIDALADKAAISLPLAAE